MKLHYSILILMSLLIPLAGKTRQSAIYRIPHADFLHGGSLASQYRLVFLHDRSDELEHVHMGRASFGVSEYLNLSLDWTGEGVSFGVKGRIMSELNGWPSLAIGVRDLFASMPMAYDLQDVEKAERTGELFIAAGRTIDPYAVRFHGGVTSLPDSKSDQFNLFVGMEKHIAGSFFITLEGWSMADRFHLLFSSTFRFLEDDRGEVVFALTDLEHLLRDSRGNTSLALRDDGRDDGVRPAISLGIGYTFPTGVGETVAFRSLEDLYQQGRDDMDALKQRLSLLEDSLEDLSVHHGHTTHRVDSLAEYIASIDSLSPEYREVYYILEDLHRHFTTRPVNYERIRRYQQDIYGLGDAAVEPLLTIVAQEDVPVPIKYQGVSVLGHMQRSEAVPLFLEQLAESQDSRYRVELIVALGFIGDRSAQDVIEELTTSADTMVSTAAREVLTMWETGAGRETLQEQSPFTIDLEYIEQ
ncbi:HEAT repeat domain-containing protein [Chitinivibrio alkaliphilus]|uniref:HEAT repeat domain-containing protein n=1 Tax=Chitinivibrio alkaliphilus ACht1 TaxID=1313304 RepID=U7D8V7_9BACT|nr:HEAT repeat domain-containing protein [Chitinivibrio alkaliphilus]ERP38819.1 hypothetical protein CALK_0591 [Chitinivibrio alkaliphilus ACht1]